MDPPFFLLVLGQLLPEVRTTLSKNHGGNVGVQHLSTFPDAKTTVSRSTLPTLTGDHVANESGNDTRTEPRTCLYR
jgi:hypothetical protein